MFFTRFATAAVPVGLMILGAGGVSAQNYPNKPVRIVTQVAGGSSDLQARILASHLTNSLGQSVIVDNRGISQVAIEAVLKAPPDGYSLLVQGANFWVSPLLQKQAYDALSDFLPVSMLSREVYLVVVNPSLPVKSIKDLIALAKAKPGDLNLAFTSIGGTSHMAGELFKSLAGINLVNVRYKGSAQAMIALISGEVQVMFVNAPAGTPHVKSGAARGLASTSATPSALVPGFPTVAASLPGYEAISASALFAPAKTPAAIINRLNGEVVRILNRPEIKQQFLDAGLEVVASSPEQTAAAIKSEMARMSKVIKDAGIRVE